jgi:hypothetical protein
MKRSDWDLLRDRRYRRAGFGVSAVMERRTETNFSSVSPKSRVDLWSSRLAAWAQVGTLFVVVFGYFYTVRPVFQNQLLQERTAELEMRKSRAEEALSVVIEHQAAVEHELLLLEKRLAEEKKVAEALNARMAVLSVRENSAKEQAQSAQKQLEDGLDALTVAQWELFGLDVRMNRFVSIQGVWADWLSVDEKGGFILESRDSWPDPFKSLLNAVERVEEKNGKSGNRTYPSNFFDGAKQFVRENKINLTCSIPDFEMMRSVYSLELKALDSAVDKEVDRRIAELVKSYEEKGERIRITIEYREAQTRSVRTVKKYEVNQHYHERLLTAKTACNRRASDVIDRLLELKGAQVL